MDSGKENAYERRIKEIEKRIEELPKGTLTYKNIKGKRQPYLQRTENGKSVSVFIKVSERERILAEIEERRNLQDELARLTAYCDRIADILSDNPYLAHTPGIGYQRIDEIIDEKVLYVDKTHFIKEWWESKCQVSLITRPRRFGKTLMLSTVNCFFSTLYEDRKDIFEGLKIWKYEEYRRMQGTFPVIFMSFAAVKASDFSGAIHTISRYCYDLYVTHGYIMDADVLSDEDKSIYTRYREGLGNEDIEYCKSAMAVLSYLLFRYHGKKVIILLDEYDTPLQEAYMKNYWEQMIDFMRGCFNETFKSNQYLCKALLTGITRITKESMFSDINNIEIYTTTSTKYADAFGFLEKEVFDCLECQDIEEKQQVKEWYDGYIFGGVSDIYNPWSIISYVANRQFRLYWANSGGYGLASRLILRGKNTIKNDLQNLLQGKSICKVLDENISFDELDNNPEAVWSFLLAAGYLKADHVKFVGMTECNLTITNRETLVLFQKMIGQWFAKADVEYNAFCNALIKGDVELMNTYINYVAMEMVSVFDVGRRPSEKAPERFYHGLVLGLVVDLREEYEITSNRESGFGRYDIMMRPKKEGLNGIIIEFKVRDEKREETLEDTLQSAFNQIEEKGYEQELLKTGLSSDGIHKYGFVFEGKEVLVGELQ